MYAPFATQNFKRILSEYAPFETQKAPLGEPSTGRSDVRCTAQIG